MLKFKGKVLCVSDEVRDFAVRDSNGNPTSQTRKRRVVKVQMLCKDSVGHNFAMLVQSYDPTWESPKDGVEWETPEVRSFENKSGMPSVFV